MYENGRENGNYLSLLFRWIRPPPRNSDQKGGLSGSLQKYANVITRRGACRTHPLPGPNWEIAREIVRGLRIMYR